MGSDQCYSTGRHKRVRHWLLQLQCSTFEEQLWAGSCSMTGVVAWSFNHCLPWPPIPPPASSGSASTLTKAQSHLRLAAQASPSLLYCATGELSMVLLKTQGAAVLPGQWVADTKHRKATPRSALALVLCLSRPHPAARPPPTVLISTPRTSVFTLLLYVSQTLDQFGRKVRVTLGTCMWHMESNM